MPCLLFILALFLPRLTAFILWLFSDWFIPLLDTNGEMVFSILGFIFMPFTLLWYSAIVNWHGGEFGPINITFLVIAVLMDLSAHGGSVRKTRKRNQD